MLNVAVIGLGVGEKHADVYKNDPGCKLICVFDFDSEKRNYAKPKYPGVKIYNDDNEDFNDKNVDVISIASYDNYHFAQIFQALENDKHVIIEKPICLNKIGF